MKLATILHNEKPHIVAETKKGLALINEPGMDVGDLLRFEYSTDAIAAQIASAKEYVDPNNAKFLAPILRPGKTVCVGLNYSDHTKESPYEQPDYPTLFLRASTSLGAHNSIVERPIASNSLDFEGELIVVLKKGGRYISEKDALDCVFGYSVGNEISVREYQFKSPQWTVGKNFDGTGTWGPFIITEDTLPKGAVGLNIETRLNGDVVQSSNTRHMIHSVASIIATISEAITLEAGDVIFAGTPAGVGFGREPKLYMKDGDVVEVEIEQIGLLYNTVQDEKQR